MSREKVRLGLRLIVSLAMVLFIFSGLAHAQQRYSLKKYFPLTEGATWTYMTVKTPDPNDIEVYSMAKISDQNQNKGTIFRRFLVDSGEPPYSYEDMNWTKNGLEVYKTGEKDLLGVGGGHTLYDPPLMRFPASMTIGQAFEQTGIASEYVNGNENPIGSYNFTWKITLAGIENQNLETYIGTFSGCLRFEVEFKTQDGNGATIEEEKWSFWLARGFGVVRSAEVPGPEHTEILSFTKGTKTYYPIP